MSAREKAISLRRAGYSYTYISERTGLSKSTLSSYLSRVPYTPNKHTRNSIGKARAKSGQTKARIKNESLAFAKYQAAKDIGQLSERDILMVGIGLYIGEGSKTQDIIRVVNSDVRVINLFIKWLCIFGYNKKNLAIRIHLYPDSDITKVESYWSLKTGLNKCQFQKAYIDSRINKDRRRRGKYQNGTAHVTVRSAGDKRFGVALSRRIGAWMEEVLE